MKILLKMLKKTRRLIKNTDAQGEETEEGDESEEVEVLEVPDLDEDDLDLAASDPDPVILDRLTEPTALAHPLDSSFERIFNFLYLLAIGDKGLKQVNFKICMRGTTSKWLDEQHEKFLTKKRHESAPQASLTTREDLRIVLLRMHGLFRIYLCRMMIYYCLFLQAYYPYYPHWDFDCCCDLCYDFDYGYN